MQLGADLHLLLSGLGRLADQSDGNNHEQGQTSGAHRGLRWVESPANLRRCGCSVRCSLHSALYLSSWFECYSPTTDGFTVHEVCGPNIMVMDRVDIILM